MSSPTNCKDCKRDLVGLAEISLGLCLDCMAKLPGELETLRAERDKLHTEGLAAATKLFEIGSMYNRRLALDGAEKSGAEAADRGFDLSQNPYKDEDARLMWEHGHQIASIEKQLAENQALVAWALTELPLVQELAEAIGPKEVAEKLDAVIQKLAPVVAELLQS
ncbi:MAG: hypothetical protein ACYDHY_07020 [Acidiferrobacterales bacterium]